jgi:nucleoside-diphosphate-sugar epimerase
MKALVTGGSGFLGGALIRDLLKLGWQVRATSRTPPKINHPNLQVHLNDLNNLAQLNEAAQGVDCVFHTAALAGVWGPRDIYFNTNVIGTENILKICQQQEIPRLIFTSSPSVIFDGHSHKNAKESDCPYPKKYLCHYPESKALAEQKVLSAHQPGTLETISLRPHLIFGPGDPHLIPRILEKAKSKRLKIVGDGQNWVDMIHVDNAAHAHILAEQALRDGRGGGEAFFISNDHPIQMWPWIQELLKVAGTPPIRGRVSANMAEKIGGLLELVYKSFGLTKEPPMTRFVAKQLSTDHSYNLEKAKQVLGYQPIISMQDATQQLHESLKSLG